MKKLTQEVFKNAPEWVKSAVITRKDKGCVFGVDMTVKEFGEWQKNGSVLQKMNFTLLGMGYKSYFWQNSAIDRETTK